MCQITGAQLKRNTGSAVLQSVRDHDQTNTQLLTGQMMRFLRPVKSRVLVCL